MNDSEGSALSMSTRAFILCAGDGLRWGDYLGHPKQLISFGGETLLDRTIRQLQELSVLDVHCVSHDSRINPGPTSNIRPRSAKFLVDSIASTQEYWTDRNVFLLGDVYFTNKSIRRICGYSGDARFFGRPWASNLVGCKHGELFALSFSGEYGPVLLNAARDVSRLAERGMRGNLWDLYHHTAKLPFNSGRAENKYFEVLDDITNDFDSPKDYELRRALYELAVSESVSTRFLLWLTLISRFPRHVVSRNAVPIEPRT